MAATITTETTFKAEFLVLISEYDRLVDAADFSGDVGVGLHTAAWTAVKRDLAKRRPPIEESDLTDPTQYRLACHLWFLARLYELSGGEQDAIEATKYYDRYRREMREIEPQVGGVTQPAAGEETQLVRG